MIEIKLPYGCSNLIVNIPEDRVQAILLSRVHEYRVKESEEEIVKRALDKPIG